MAGMAAVAAVFTSGTAQAGSQVTTITSVPYTICQSGNYALASNLTLNEGTAISICPGVGHVDLEGKGHTITDNSPLSIIDTGISVGDGAGYITVRGFTLSLFGKGIYALNPFADTLSNNKLVGSYTAGIEVNGEGGSGTTISGNTATQNVGFGIWLADEGTTYPPIGDTVKGNTVSSNQTTGIEISGTDNTVVSNTVTGNTTAGIEIADYNGIPSANNTVASNKATGNGTDLVDVSLPACYNGWGNNTFATKNEGSIYTSTATYGCIR